MNDTIDIQADLHDELGKLVWQENDATQSGAKLWFRILGRLVFGFVVFVGVPMIALWCAILGASKILSMFGSIGH